jgi:enolase
MFALEMASVRGIFDSRAKLTLEADVTLRGGARGRASAPAAIAPGRRERPRSTVRAIGQCRGAIRHLCDSLAAGRFADQAAFDDVLERAAERAGLGTNVTLPLSLATCRANADDRGVPLHRHLAELSGLSPRLPAPLVNVFSGGVHHSGDPASFQQIMLAPDAGDGRDVVRQLEVCRDVFELVEQQLVADGVVPELSASSGLIVGSVGSCELVRRLAGTLRLLGTRAHVGLRLGVDVAAEHLRTADGRYRLEASSISGERLSRTLVDLVDECDIGYVEDPFDAVDLQAWRALTRRVGSAVTVAADDPTATQVRFIDASVASAIVLKPSQVGTITRTLEAARVAHASGMELCVSHRSGETEDTGICDLAFAVGATRLKLGGPRRGDRIAKWNQLLRLAEAELHTEREKSCARPLS